MVGISLPQRPEKFEHGGPILGMQLTVVSDDLDERLILRLAQIFVPASGGETRLRLQVEVGIAHPGETPDQ